jgi:hypothetical protein
VTAPDTELSWVVLGAAGGVGAVGWWLAARLGALATPAVAGLLLWSVAVDGRGRHCSNGRARLPGCAVGGALWRVGARHLPTPVAEVGAMGQPGCFGPAPGGHSGGLPYCRDNPIHRGRRICCARHHDVLGQCIGALEDGPRPLLLGNGS